MPPGREDHPDPPQQWDGTCQRLEAQLQAAGAGIELVEARQLVFIGYSLPHADFEFRQLLSRMVHRDATIDIVLFEGTSETKRGGIRPSRIGIGSSGGRELRFHSNGVIDFVKAHVTPS